MPMPTPRLLVDENFPAPAMQALRTAGADVLSVAELAPSTSDEALLARPDEIEGYFCVWRRDGMRKRPLPGGGR